MARREPLSPLTLTKFRDEAEWYARNSFDGRQLLADHGIAWDDASATWERILPQEARERLDDRISGHWRRRYTEVCAKLAAGSA